MIKITSTGSYDKLQKNLYSLIHNSPFKKFGLDKYGIEGVKLLKEATPKDTGKTADSWNYKIDINDNKISLTFTNSNLTKTGIPIAILVDYGHATSSGYYVKGKYFINKTIQPLFEKMAKEIWKEVQNVK